MARQPVDEREQGEAGEQGEHAERGALRAATADAREAACAPAVIRRNQVDGPHRGTSTVASPAATDNRLVEISPSRPVSTRPTASLRTSSPSDSCRAWGKPGRSRTAPLSDR